MKVSLPVYVVGLVAAFVYGLLKFYIPTLPFTEEQVLYIIVAVLAILGVDVTQMALRTRAEVKAMLANLKGQKIL
jgi:hypothetical protein